MAHIRGIRTVSQRVKSSSRSWRKGKLKETNAF